MVFADLHVHTTASDGTMPLSAIPAAARGVGVRAVAVTDHERPHPELDDPIVQREGVTIVHGLEVRVEAPTEQRVDLLGYGLTRTAALESMVERVQRNRVERGHAIVDRVERYLDLELDVTVGPGTGRPHVARAIENHPDAPYDYAGAFADLIGSDGPCYVPREIPSFERAVAVLRDSCALVGLAHPLRYREPADALALAADLDAVERWYPYEDAVDDGDEALVERTIADHDLVPTGGSDAHDDVLGRAGLDRDSFQTFRTACGWD